MKNVLTIAGSDCSGGAGVQADLKTMCALGVYGMSVITALTAQNTRGVFKVLEIEGAMVTAQIEAVYRDIRVDAVKIGMVSSPEIIRAVKDALERFGSATRHIVFDPVMVSKSGYALLRPEALGEVRSLAAIAAMLTPNIPEAELLSGVSIRDEGDMTRAAERIAGLGAKHILIKGGHRLGSGAAKDLLFTEGRVVRLEGPRIDTKHTHGTGCTLSSALACFLAFGYTAEDAAKAAKEYITQAITDGYPVGHGVGPVGHLNALYRKAGVRYDRYDQ
ncbi:MAG: bifunctional hydroxymethylpyrimidine kinase/phosphomethylpyrimidine kinase [Spirochaetaceae bacterium]|jgi:hydroxymethylpyrimidine/phosphomethylpyrimidine kinase|nr:bifunctional hydroxymethylpyrimidine kinase/phosphomethylpyrimidine kinase [Spirochaetaceae bacterium]